MKLFLSRKKIEPINPNNNEKPETQIEYRNRN